MYVYMYIHIIYIYIYIYTRIVSVRTNRVLNKHKAKSIIQIYTHC